MLQLQAMMLRRTPNEKLCVALAGWRQDHQWVPGHIYVLHHIPHEAECVLSRGHRRRVQCCNVRIIGRILQPTEQERKKYHTAHKDTALILLWYPIWRLRQFIFQNLKCR